VFATLTFSLRAISRARLAEMLERRGKTRFLQPILDRAAELAFAASVGRLFANILIVLLSLYLVEQLTKGDLYRYGGAALLAGLITMFFSVLLPQVLSEHMGTLIVASAARPLRWLSIVASPLVGLLHVTDRVVRSATGGPQPVQSDEVEQEILAVFEESEKEGVVAGQERELIESVFDFGDATVGQIMTPRSQIEAVDVSATKDEILHAIETSGHSRLPVIRDSLDVVVGMLHARDLLHSISQPAKDFALAPLIRRAVFVPETKLLPDLLRDFRQQKVQAAIVLDEYGGTAGLVTIEDIFEQLIGDISDEHEPAEPPMLRRIDDHTIEADAKIYIDELNRETGLKLPDDAGFETLGGYVSTTLGRIPEKGTTFQGDGAKFTVLEAEPQRVNRVRIELMLHPEPAN
jgi:CBS domain containing-hemolysin-like protein